ncbi:MAG: hypothetical protein QOI40_903 [Alphaproteobacteria bacterium]|nr:hypothetical protein [Alphaproteobacteria bacterium]
MNYLPRRLLTMLSLLAPVLFASAMAAAAPAPAEDSIRLELNAAESVQNRCRLSFVIENKSESPIETLKLDLGVFSREGIIQRRLVTEMGPVLRIKTMIKAFEIDGDCGQVGSILVNDIAACSPGEPNFCLERLLLSSRVQSVRLFK